MSVMEVKALSRSERRKQQTREMLRQACRELLAERSYEGLTIQAITERADLGYGTFYLHFEDKDDIVWDVIHEYAEVYEQEMDARLANVPFPRREYLSWLYVFDYVAQVREPFRAMFGTRGSAALTQRYVDYLTQLHAKNIGDEKYRVTVDLPAEFLAQFMSGALLRLLVWWVETPNPYTTEDMASMLFETIYHHPPPRDEAR